MHKARALEGGESHASDIDEDVRHTFVAGLMVQPSEKLPPRYTYHDDNVELHRHQFQQWGQRQGVREQKEEPDVGDGVRRRGSGEPFVVVGTSSNRIADGIDNDADVRADGSIRTNAGLGEGNSGRSGRDPFLTPCGIRMCERQMGQPYRQDGGSRGADITNMSPSTVDSMRGAFAREAMGELHEHSANIGMRPLPAQRQTTEGNAGGVGGHGPGSASAPIFATTTFSTEISCRTAVPRAISTHGVVMTTPTPGSGRCQEPQGDVPYPLRALQSPFAAVPGCHRRTDCNGKYQLGSTSGEEERNNAVRGNDNFGSVDGVGRRRGEEAEHVLSNSPRSRRGAGTETVSTLLSLAVEGRTKLLKNTAMASIVDKASLSGALTCDDAIDDHHKGTVEGEQRSDEGVTEPSPAGIGERQEAALKAFLRGVSCSQAHSSR